MSDIVLPQELLDRIVSRRGRLHLFETLAPRETALLVVDMQDTYLEEEAAGYVASGRKIAPAVNRLAGVVRALGGKVFWLRNTLGTDALQSWNAYCRLRTVSQRDRMLKALEKQTPGHRIWAGMDVKADDSIVDKRRYSAFIAGSSDLESRLRTRGLNTILITGLLANVCCESTARDAMMLNFNVIMIADGLAAHSEEELRMTLANTLFAFGDVMSCDHVIRILRQN